jgi:pyruvate formate lyase activating enzyme
MCCKSVAFTYNDPVLWAEYAIDTAKACRERGIKAVAVDRRLHHARGREPFFEVMDAANVDLKGSPRSSTRSTPSRTSSRCSTRSAG